MNPQVTQYIEKLAQPWQAEISSQVRQLVLNAVPTAEERLQYGKPHFLKNGKYIAVLGTAKGWVSFTIFNAQAINTPDGLFEASDTGDRKTIKIREGQTVDYSLLQTLVAQASSSV